MDDLIEEFVAEVSEALVEIDTDLLKLEQNPEDKNLLDNIFRLMHTVKGTCGFLALSRLESVAHTTENMLDEFRKGAMSVTPEAVTLILSSIDRVRELVVHLKAEGSEPEGSDDDVIKPIDQFMEEGGAEGAVEAAENLEEDMQDAAPANSDDASQEQEMAQSSEEVVVETAQAPQEEVKSEDPKAAAAKKPETSNESLRVPVNVLENMINMVSELVLTRNQLIQQVKGEDKNSLQVPLSKLDKIVSDLQECVMKTRMQPISNAWVKLPRIVRDLSLELGKKIELEMRGEETELDRQVLELIKDPLTHMIRNSCDHGVEMPDDRAAKGKSETGKIILSAYHEGGFVIIEVQDDGQGLDPEKIAKKAIEKGMLDESKADSLGRKDILSFIMKAGFSTAEQVTKVSGRGVGMDVVKSNIENIGGSIEMDSIHGSGTTFTIKIPLTLAIISSLVVSIAGNQYAIPQLNIQELVSINGSNNGLIEYINGKPILRLRDRIIPLLDSQILFSLSGDQDEEVERNKVVVVMNTGSSSYGLIVDDIHDTEEVVIKSVSSALSDTVIYSGYTILGNGSVTMILDPGAIARHYNVESVLSAHQEASIEEDKTKHDDQDKVPLLLFTAGEGAEKAIPLELVSRLQEFKRDDISSSDDILMTTFEGEMIKLSMIAQASLDQLSENVLTLILKDDQTDKALGLIIDGVKDITESNLDLNTSSARTGILGSILVNEQIKDLIDIAHFLNADDKIWYESEVIRSFDHGIEMEEDDEEDLMEASSSSEPTEDQASNMPEAIQPEEIAKEEGASSPAAEKSAAAKKGKSATKVARRAVMSGDGRPRILIVDDSNFFRSMLKPILVANGFDVMVSKDAREAIDLHDKGEMFDIILSDIEMPVINGLEFVKTMRKDSHWSDLPFIAMTTHNSPEDIKMGLKCGFDQYIRKFDKTELLESIKNVSSTTRH